MRRAAVTAHLVALGLTLYRFPPAQYHFYPVCPIHWATGLLCPGCGATRALAALLQGQVHQALTFDALLVLVMLPLAFVYVAFAFGRGRWISVPLPAVYVFGAVAIAFTVARNLN